MATKLTPQAREVLRYLLNKGYITQLYAFNEFGINRLASRVYELKQYGIPVQKRMCRSFSGKSYAEYYIDGSEYASFNSRG